MKNGMKLNARMIACVVLIGLAVLLTAGAEAVSPKTVRISGEAGIPAERLADGAQIEGGNGRTACTLQTVVLPSSFSSPRGNHNPHGR